MKLHRFDRILLLILCVICLTSVLIMFILATGLIPTETILAWTGALYGSSGYAITLVVSGLLLTGISLRLIFAMRRSEREAVQEETITIASGDDGSAYITLTAIKEMVSSVCACEKQIAKASPVVQRNGDGIAIGVRLRLEDQAVIQEIAGRLKADIREKIQEYTGLTVQSVDILVEESMNGRSV